MIAELFEVNNGGLKGVYLKVDNAIHSLDQFELMYKGLQAVYIGIENSDFYIEHRAANDETLQTLIAFEQLATIWRLNANGMSNQETLELKGQKITETIGKLKTIYSQA
ncbi:hypothetical protein [Bacillus sp. Brlt_9]|uniref:hypothetical protein n=1 Tax=Bacillus sp. Brlt_9 TaxID=3110916 RepID=UPI003F7BF954